MLSNRSTLIGRRNEGPFSLDHQMSMIKLDFIPYCTQEEIIFHKKLNTNSMDKHKIDNKQDKHYHAFLDTINRISQTLQLMCLAKATQYIHLESMFTAMY